MPHLQPRSILQLVLVGFLVVLLPLLGALIYAASALNSMSQAGSNRLEVVSDTAEVVQKLTKGAVDLERLARQYQLLSDSALLTAFNVETANYQTSLANLRILRPEPSILLHAERLEELLGDLKREVNAPSPGKTGRSLASIALLNDALQQMRQALEIDLKTKVSVAKDLAQTIRSRLVILAFTLVPSTLILIGLFSMLITRPIKLIDRSIRQIGIGSYTPPKRLPGPRDLQIVGERLKWLGQRLRASEEAQERFLRHISHELKTPLATIKEGIELLGDEIPGPLNKQQEEVISILRSGLQHFQVLINNLLDFNLLRNNKSLQREEVEVGELIESIVRLHRLTAQRKSVEFEVSGDPTRLVVDRSVLSAAIDNLVSNAVHFSPEGGKVLLRWTKKADGLTILVGDEGPGIDQDERDKVFLPFYQGKALRLGPIKGTGLGLSVARECVELHKGQIRIIDAERGAWLEMFFPSAAVQLS